MLDQPKTDHRDDFRDYLREGNFLSNAPQMIPLTLALYQLLGEGVPAHRSALAKRLGLSPAELDCALNDIPRSMIEFDALGAITAFGGLSLTPANHEFKTRNAGLYTWCVFDALFLPEILGTSATVSTRCPATGEAIEFDLSPCEIISSRPSGPVMSIITPDRDACCENLRGAFCNHVNLFVNERVFHDWAAGRADIVHISLENAHQLAHQRNRFRYGDCLRTK